MGKNTVVEKLEEYNDYLYSHKPARHAVSFCVFVSWLIHFAAVIIFAVKLCEVADSDLLYKIYEAVPFIENFMSLLSFYTADNILPFILFSLVSAYVFPLMIGMILVVLFEMVCVHFGEIPQMNSYTVAEFNKALKKYKFINNDFRALHMIFEIGLITYFYFTAKNDFILPIVIFAPIAVVYTLIVPKVITDSSAYRKMYIKFCGMNKDVEEYEKQQQELLRQQQLQMETERRKREAENLFRQMLNPERNILEVKRLADLGSVSAGFYYGKILWQKMKNEPLTDNEEKKCGEQAIKYLSEAVKLGYAEARFFTLSIKAKTESHNSEGWQACLDEARAVKASGMLDNAYAEDLDKLISDFIYGVNKAEELAREQWNQRMNEIRSMVESTSEFDWYEQQRREQEEEEARRKQEADDWFDWYTSAHPIDVTGM